MHHSIAKVIMRHLFICALFCLCPTTLLGTDINAASCSQAHVQAAVNSAATGTSWDTDGDRVLVPAGDCTWSSRVDVTGKNISVVGNGIGSTIIRIGHGGSAGSAFALGTAKARISAFSIILTSGDQVIYARGRGFRIDNNALTNSTSPIVSKVCVYVAGNSSLAIPHPDGLIDHNTFTNCRTYLQADLALLANDIWAEASKLGTSGGTGVLYIEDNTIDRTGESNKNCVDEQYGGRYVFRYNNCVNSYAEVHSAHGSDRASRSWEIYNNSFFTDNATFACMFIRGGTGMVFNNTCNGNHSGWITLDNVRSFSSAVLGTTMGGCDGTSAYDENQSGQLGWRCRDQIGTDTDLGTPPGSGQTFSPAYFWGNTNDGAQVNPAVGNCGATIKTNGSCADLRENSNYYRENTSFDGTAGVGVGVVASRPATCTTGVGYWATDESKFYKCTATDTWTLYYEPYTYPHPLQGVEEGSGCVASLNQTGFDWSSGSLGVVRPGTQTSAVASLTNTGDALCTITSISISGGSASAFSVSSDCGATLAASASCTLTVTFVPKQAGAATQRTLTVDMAAGTDDTMTLDGTGLTIPSGGVRRR